MSKWLNKQKLNKNKKNKGDKILTVFVFALLLLFTYSAMFKSYSSPTINILLGISSLFLLLVLSDMVDKMNGYGKYAGHTKDSNRHMEETINNDQAINEKIVDDSSQNNESKDDYVDFEPDFDIEQKSEEKPNDSEYQQLED